MIKDKGHKCVIFVKDLYRDGKIVSLKTIGQCNIRKKNKHFIYVWGYYINTQNFLGTLKIYEYLLTSKYKNILFKLVNRKKLSFKKSRHVIYVNFTNDKYSYVKILAFANWTRESLFDRQTFRQIAIKCYILQLVKLVHLYVYLEIAGFRDFIDIFISTMNILSIYCFLKVSTCFLFFGAFFCVYCFVVVFRSYN